jgi:hypothetical protein
MAIGVPWSLALDPIGNPCDRFNSTELKNSTLDEELNRIDRDELMSESDEILQKLAEFRGLKVKAKVEKAFKNKAFFKNYFRKSMEKETPVSSRSGYEDAMVWLGLLPPHSDWLAKISETMSDRILGLYDPETKMLYLADWRSPQQLRETMIHEMVHALQDQNFGLYERQKEVLQWLSRGNQDRAMALQALWEGEAVALTWAYRKSTGEDPELKQESSFENWLRVNRQIENGRRRAWGCPLRMTEYLNFPYVQGALFVQKTYEAKGWKGVDQLWANPPVSSLEILSGGKDVSDIGEIRLFKNAPGALDGGKCVWAQTMGAYGLLEYLFNFIGEKNARAAVDGWRGDRFEFWRSSNGDWKALLANIFFSDKQVAGAFADTFAISQWRRFPIASIVEKTESIQWLKTSHKDECTYVEWSDKNVLVIEGLEASKTAAVREVLLREKPVLTHGERVFTVPLE